MIDIVTGRSITGAGMQFKRIDDENARRYTSEFSK